jgi:hypothetical protein
MSSIKKYSALAVVGAGLALAAASPASACGAFGMVGVPVFGAAYGGCGGFGMAGPPVFGAAFGGWGGGCMPVAFGCGGFGGGYGFAPTFGFAPSYGYGSYGYAPGYYGAAYGYGCHHAMYHRGLGYGYAMAFHRPAFGYAVAFRRPVGFGMAFHRTLRTTVAFRSYRPSHVAVHITRSYHRIAFHGIRHHFAMRHTSFRVG